MANLITKKFELSKNRETISIVDISCTVKNAIIFLKSVCANNLNVASITPKNTKNIKTFTHSFKSGLNLIRPNNAVLTKIPLRNIEKLVFASTCVFVSQK